MRRVSGLLTAAIASQLLAACAAHAPARNASPPPNANVRVVTLVPSFADDLYAIGAGAALVAVSAFTDAPQAKALPRIGDASSIDAEAIIALRPSVVIGIPAQTRLVEPLRRARVAVVLLPDDTFASIFTNLRVIGTLTHREREAAATIGRLRSETAAIHAQTRRFVRRPSVFVVLGAVPIWTVGTASYITSLLELAGARNAAADFHGAYGEYSAEALVRAQPDLIVADPATNLKGVLEREPWRSLRAVQLHRIAYMNPDDVERPGPGYNAGLRWLVDRVTPLASSPR